MTLILLGRYYKNGWPLKLKEYVLLGYGECPNTKMTATGIPPHLAVAGEVANLREEIADLKQRLDVYHDSNKRDLPELVVQAMEGRVRVEGQVDLTRRDLEDLIQSLETRLGSRLERALNGDSSRNGDSVEINASDVLVDDLTLWSHCWNGALHPVPKGWVLDKKDAAGRSILNVKALWELWFFGHAVDRVPPYRKLLTKDLFVENNRSLTANNRSYLGRCKIVMNEFLEIAHTQNNIACVNGTCLLKMNVIERDRVFSECFTELNRRMGIREDARRVGELKIRTYANDIYNYRKTRGSE